MLKKSTRSPMGMPLARKSKIFGLRSIPANTTPSALEKPLNKRFFAYKVFFRRTCQRKNKKCGVTAAKTDFVVYRQTESSEIRSFLFYTVVFCFSSISDASCKSSIVIRLSCGMGFHVTFLNKATYCVYLPIISKVGQVKE